jgi:hypothetical protein
MQHVLHSSQQISSQSQLVCVALRCVLRTYVEDEGEAGQVVLLELLHILERPVPPFHCNRG